MNFFLFLVILLMLFFMLFFFIINNFFLFFFLMEWKMFMLILDFNFLKILFFILLNIVVLSVFLFMNFYLNNEKYFNYFFSVLMIFILSMIFLNFSNNYFMMILSWDILGISSYFLVLFYNNWDSNIGSMNVSLTNRLGDFFMFYFFSFFFFINLNFNFLNFYYFLLIFMILVMGFTKSAQYPFSSWLPKAMSAPTPVSALVHSSTLVTAGLILFLNFDFFKMNLSFNFFLLIFGLFTMMLASLMSLKEKDLKKVVALSTLSQMGFSVLILGLNLNYFCLLHLVSHALFKSCLFIQIGLLIYFMYGQQDNRFYSGLKNFFNFIKWQIFLTLFCLCGLFFSSGMMSKDMVLELFFFFNKNILLKIIFFFSILMTFFYSYILFLGLMKNNSLIFNFYLKNYKIFMSFFLFFFSLVGLMYLNLNLFIFPSVILMIDFFSPLMFLFLFLFFIFMKKNKFLKFMKYSFMVDYFAKIFSFFLKNFKFIDLIINNFLNLIYLVNLKKNKLLIFNNFFFFIFFSLMMILNF